MASLSNPGSPAVTCREPLPPSVADKWVTSDFLSGGGGRRSVAGTAKTLAWPITRTPSVAYRMRN